MITRLLTFSIVTLAACALHSRNGAELQLDSVRPDSVLIASGAISEVVLRGHGFAPDSPGHNTVMFGTHAISNVPANKEGTEIHLVIPEQLPSGSEAPPTSLDAGPYQIRVRTATGESNSVTVRVFR